jgi:hypothetical protein
MGLAFDEAVKKYHSYERTGWVYFTEPVAGTESVAEAKFKPYRIILEAMENGDIVDQWVLDQAELMKNMNVGANEQMYQNMLDTWDNTVLMVKDFSHLPIYDYDKNGDIVIEREANGDPLKDEDGNDIPIPISANQANIAREAERRGVPIKTIRVGLLKAHHELTKD